MPQRGSNLPKLFKILVLNNLKDGNSRMNLRLLLLNKEKIIVESLIQRAGMIKDLFNNRYKEEELV